MLKSKATSGVAHNVAEALSSERVDDKTPVPPPDWEALIQRIAEDIMAEHSPNRILEVRAKLYDLLSHCIPSTIILKVWLHFTSRPY